MKLIRQFSAILVFATITLLVAACGGGGGSSSTAPPAAGISITAANAEQVTATVVNSLDIVEGVSSGSGILAGVAANPAGSGFNYPAFFLKSLQWMPPWSGQLNNGSVTGEVVGPVPVDCTDILGGTSGTFTVTADVTDTTLTFFYAGDTFNIVFNACVIDGVVLNGGMSMTITAVTPNPFHASSSPLTIDLATVLSGFSANDAGFIVTGDGDMAVSVDAATSDEVTTVLSGNSLLASAGSETERLTGYQYEIWNNVISADYSVDVSGTIATTTLGGSVSYVSTTTFTGNDNSLPNGDPTAGVMLVTTSADNSRARVTAQPDGVNLQIEVDHDGDGLYEDTIMTTWDDLRAL